MKHKMSWVWALMLASSMAGGVHAQPLDVSTTEVRGTVEQWAPGASVIKVGGVTYTLSKEVQVMDANTALLSSNAVRSGGSVLLLFSQGVVTHVVVKPGSEAVMDQPKK